MLDSAQFAGHIGFTEEETKALCEQYGCDFAEFQRWYDGYKLSDEVSLFNPKSVTSSISRWHRPRQCRTQHKLAPTG